MLSIGKLGAGQERYYTEKVAEGAEDYYSGEGEAEGHWIGSAAADLGLSGKVDPDGLTAMLTGRHPASGDPLGLRHVAGRGPVPGFDLTFSAPKSVSLTWAFGGEGAGAEVAAAHRESVAAALAYMERAACWTRRGHGGHQFFHGDGLFAAAYLHRSSRAGDPQLHTHVLVANATRGPDGRWTRLYHPAIYDHAKTAGYIYEANLRHELTRRLGVRWQEVANGIAEIEGFDPDHLRAFSTRRAEILAATAPDASARARQVAALDTRRAKGRDLTEESLRERWRSRVGAVGSEGVELVGIDTARRLCVDADYLGRVNPADGSPALQHAYAATTYQAQGSTVDRAYVMADPSMDRQGFYVAASRSRGETFFYATPEVDLEREEYAPTSPAREGLAHIAAAAERDGAQISAHDQALRSRLEPLTSSELARLRDELRSEAGAERQAERRLADLEGRISGAEGRLADLDAERRALGPEPRRRRERDEYGEALGRIEARERLCARLGAAHPRPSRRLRVDRPSLGAGPLAGAGWRASDLTDRQLATVTEMRWRAALATASVAPARRPSSPGFAGAPCGPRLRLGFRSPRPARFGGCQSRWSGGRCGPRGGARRDDKADQDLDPGRLPPPHQGLHRRSMHLFLRRRVASPRKAGDRDVPNLCRGTGGKGQP